ncbi:MAG: nitrite/sulfite reductase, partial [Terricaulis sp.]
VKKSELFAVWQRAKEIGFATPNIGLLTDIIACPGGDYCSLANAKSIPVAQAIQQRVEEKLGDLDYLHDIGDISLNISGCMNACGHHHVGNIGILGVDKHGAEFYQVSIGGSQGLQASLGKVIGPSFAQDEMPDVIERIVATYIDRRHVDETFLEAVQRLGIEPFKERVYAHHS